MGPPAVVDEDVVDRSRRVREQRGEPFGEGDDVPSIAQVVPAAHPTGPRAPARPGCRSQPVEDQVGDAERRADGDQGRDGPLGVCAQRLVRDHGSEGVADEHAGLGGHTVGDLPLNAVADEVVGEIAVYLFQDPDQEAVGHARQERRPAERVQRSLHRVRYGGLAPCRAGVRRARQVRRGHPVRLQPVRLSPEGQQQFGFERTHHITVGVRRFALDGGGAGRSEPVSVEGDFDVVGLERRAVGQAYAVQQRGRDAAVKRVLAQVLVSDAVHDHDSCHRSASPAGPSSAE